MTPLNSQSYESFWKEAMVLLTRPAQILSLLLHPNQLLILEAMARLDMPISATVMERITDHQVKKATFSYHLGRLIDLGIVENVGNEPRRGVTEKFYELVPAEKEKS